MVGATEISRQLEVSPGVRVAYWVSPARDRAAGVLGLLHGAASNHSRWSELLDHASLTKRWDVLRPDLRGNGCSMWRGRLDLETWSRDLDAILTAEGWPEAVLAGHSLGAQIAIDFAARFPHRARGLALIDPVFPRALVGKRRHLYRGRHLLRAAAGVARALNAAGLGRRSFPERDLRLLDRETRAALRGEGAIEEIARRYSALGPILRYMPTANYFQQLAATVAPLPDLGAIGCPVLVVLSGDVSFADPAINRAEIERFPRVEAVTVAANHWPLTERPEEVRKLIEDWVDRRWPETPPR